MHTNIWMHRNKDQLYETIKDLKTKNDFEEEINKRTKECDGLLDEDTIAMLIVDELGRNIQTINKIKDLHSGLETTVFGRITSLGNSRDFTKKNGSNGTVINLGFTDDTGACNLVLWNKDVKLVKDKTIKKGSNVKIINGYIKDGYNGLELNVGRWSIIEVEPDDIPVFKNNNLSPSKNEIIGTLVETKPTHAFFKDNGEIGFVTNIKIKNKDGMKHLTVWDEKVKEIQGFKVGDQIKIDNVDIRNNNGKPGLNVNGKSTIMRV